MIEITVSVKGDDSSFKQKFLCYEECVLSPTDNTIQGFIKEAMANAKIEDPEVKVRALLQL